MKIRLAASSGQSREGRYRRIGLATDSIRCEPENIAKKNSCRSAISAGFWPFLGPLGLLTQLINGTAEKVVTAAEERQD